MRNPPESSSISRYEAHRAEVVAGGRPFAGARSNLGHQPRGPVEVGHSLVEPVVGQPEPGGVPGVGGPHGGPPIGQIPRKPRQPDHALSGPRTTPAHTTPKR